MSIMMRQCTSDSRRADFPSAAPTGTRHRRRHNALHNKEETRMKLSAKLTLALSIAFAGGSIVTNPFAAEG